MRYLALAFAFLASAPSATGQTAGLICGGAEPFWALEFSDETALFSWPDGADIDYDIELQTQAMGRVTPVAITLISRADTAIAILAERTCNDTMSDLKYSHSLDVLTQRNSEAILLTGCCRMRP